MRSAMDFLSFFPETVAAAKQGSGERDFDDCHRHKCRITSMCQPGNKAAQYNHCQQKEKKAHAVEVPEFWLFKGINSFQVFNA